MLLPPELWDHVLAFVPRDELQRTSLALTRALPSCDVSSAILWRHVRLSREGQAWQAIHKLRQSPPGVKGAVKSVTATAFREDAQQLVNFVLSLPAPEHLALHVGPLFAPEQLDELLAPASALESHRFRRLSVLKFRFNPYCMERSYFVFLKGTYFDSIVHNLAHFGSDTAPRLRHLEFVQDLSPNHGSRKKKDTPAFGLHELRHALDGLDQDVRIDASVQPPASGRFARKTLEEHGRMDFAQPIVFFRLDCLGPLSISPVGQHLSSLTLRLPRRNVLPALTLETSPLNPPFRSLVHLDLSTTHVVDDSRLATLVRLLPRLESLVIDRCTGLVSEEAVDEPTALQTVKWLAKVCAGSGLARAEEAMRNWKRIVKERPTDAPNLAAGDARARRRQQRTQSGDFASQQEQSTTSNETTTTTTMVDALVPAVKELFVIPPPPRLSTLGCGLHELGSATTTTTVAAWDEAFSSGYAEAIDRARDKVESLVERWDLWRRTGKLEDRTRRMCTFRDAFETREYLELVGRGGGRRRRGGADGANAEEEEEEEEDPDPLFDKFCRSRGLVAIDSATALDLVELHEKKLEQFTVCFVPDCGNLAGIPRLSLNATGENLDDRERREKSVDEVERAEWDRVRKLGRHKVGCAHLRGREARGEDDTG